MCISCSDGFEKSGIIYGLDIYLKDIYLKESYEINPLRTKIIMIPAGALVGLLEVLVFPILSLIGLLITSGMALYQFMKGDKAEAVKWLKGATVCLLGTLASASFIVITGFYVPLIWSSVCFVGFAVICITVHVYKMVQEPSSKEISPVFTLIK